MSVIVIISFFTFLIHLTESVTYCFRLAGLRARQLAIGLSFVTSALLVSRLSNMFQAPLLGAAVDRAIMAQTPQAITQLDSAFRWIIGAAFVGSLLGALLTPSLVRVFQSAITEFCQTGSLIKLVFNGLHPKRLWHFVSSLRFPRWEAIRTISLRGIPKQFLVFNVFVSAIYTIGVLCSLSAGAHLPDLRSTAIQLSGIVNGLATILFTLFVDPAGARITDQAYNHQRSELDVRSVVFFMLLGRMVGTLIIAQLAYWPFVHYIMFVTTSVSRFFVF